MNERISSVQTTNAVSPRDGSIPSPEYPGQQPAEASRAARTVHGHVDGQAQKMAVWNTRRHREGGMLALEEEATCSCCIGSSFNVYGGYHFACCAADYSLISYVLCQFDGVYMHETLLELC